MEEKELVTGQAFQLMDRLDDELILAELKGEILETYVYDFEVAGRTVRGLSKAGIDAACAEVARRGEAIRELDIEWEITEDAVLFAVKAARFAILENGTERQLDAVIGTKRQPKTMTLRSGGVADDPFWFEKGAAKAGRNARRRLLPEKLIVELVNAYITEGKVKRKSLPGSGQIKKGQTQSPTPRAILGKYPHWMKDPKVRPRFWARVRNEPPDGFGLSDRQAHEACHNVKSILDFNGTMQEALDLLEAYVRDHTPEPEPRPEPVEGEQEHIPF